jgi:stearoyl-CoA desaturase (delta-9 desaturase)
VFTGLIHLPPWGYVLVALAATHVTIAAVTIYLHRHQAHRAIELHPLAAHFFRLWLWLTTGMSTREWAAIHRKHHACVETGDDPHSPQVRGIRKVLWQGTELYRAEARNLETLAKYGHGAPADWLERHLYARRSAGVGLTLVIDFLLFGFAGLTVWAVQMMWIPFFAAGVINGVGHWRGYRNFECPDASTNIVPWGLLIGGEELHNNHHAFASSAKFSSRWWELDLGWCYIRVLGALGLARVRKIAPRPHLRRDKLVADLDTLRAIVVNRLHVASAYARQVVKRVHREELRLVGARNSRRLLRRARRLLIREASLLDEEAKHILERTFACSRRLEVVYQFNLQLQAIWSERTARPEVLLHLLQDWCRRAEATGIKALGEFAERLRGYSLQAAT